ncbi:MAG: hypothetical protein R3C18_27910 [Planctomycetaceae bacterium]
MNLKQQLTSLSFQPVVKAVSIEGLPTVYVRRLSWGELSQVQQLDDPRQQVCLVLCDESGQRLFSESEAAVFDGYPPEILKSILDEATSFNSLDQQVRQAKNDSGTVPSKCS